MNCAQQSGGGPPQSKTWRKFLRSLTRAMPQPRTRRGNARLKRAKNSTVSCLISLLRLTERAALRALAVKRRCGLIRRGCGKDWPAGPSFAEASAGQPAHPGLFFLSVIHRDIDAASLTIVSPPDAQEHAFAVSFVAGFYGIVGRPHGLAIDFLDDIAFAQTGFG
jgi:hypothetical protein